MIFSIIAATQGRLTLPNMLESCAPEKQGGIQSEIIIVADTYEPLFSNVKNTCKEYGAEYLEYDAGCHAFGHPQAQKGTEAATGDWLLYLGDDDILDEGALKTIYDVLLKSIELPHLFKIVMHPSPSRPISKPWHLWQQPILRRGSISAQNIVTPNDPARLGFWYDDFAFIQSTIAKHDGRVIWRPEYIATCY